ncbi:hypothetical protein GCM10011532_01680 [Christiangramia forsetii]|uniref:CarboxypepD_reg-like domain-containing protein n=1 Tax=Christiangramia forsetii TaxID=411153 RepID=A0ABQ1WC22_9FLAO|nr:hypothetical protein GCM10011532_01680 [Christiangramia forsetii]
MLLFFQHSEAQERQVLKGQIIVDSIQNSSGVHVINLNAETGTTTDVNGKFLIPARTGDTIFFSSIQFENKQFIVRDANFETPIKVRLIDKFNELDEVQLDDIRLSGVLSEDVTRMPKSIYEKLGMPFPKPRRTSLELAIQSATSGGPLVSVINRLNGTAERLEKAEKNNQISILVNKGLNLVGKSFFVSQLDINEQEIINFLFYCADDPKYKELVDAESLLKMIEFFNTKVDSFKELRELD